MSTLNHIPKRSVAHLEPSPQDAGALGIVHTVEQLSKLEAFYQYEALRAAPLEFQIAGRVRYAALRRRLFGDRWVA